MYWIFEYFLSITKKFIRKCKQRQLANSLNCSFQVLKINNSTYFSGRHFTSSATNPQLSTITAPSVTLSSFAQILRCQISLSMVSYEITDDARFALSRRMYDLYWVSQHKVAEPRTKIKIKSKSKYNWQNNVYEIVTHQ